MTVIVLSLVGYAVLCWASIRVLKFTESVHLRPFFVPYIFFKIAGGVSVGIIYLYFYQAGDTLTYFTQAKVLHQLVLEDPNRFFSILIEDAGLPYAGQPRAQLMLKVIFLLSFLGFNTYFGIVVHFAVLSGLSAWLLADTLVTVYRKVLPVVASVLFLPTVLFWSSGLLKETLSTALLFLLIHYLLRIVKKNESYPSSYLKIVLAFAVLALLKYYYAAVAGPIVFSMLIIYHLEKRILLRRRFAVLGFTGIFLLMGFCGSLLHPNLNPGRLPNVIVNNHDLYISSSREDNTIHFRDLEPTWSRIVANIPIALLSGLYRPFPSERGNLFKRIIGAGNLFLLILTVPALRQKWPTDKLDSVLLLGGILYILIEATFICLSTPNFGTLSRYKTGYIPLFLYLILLRHPVEGWLSNRLSKVKWINQ